jgi:site-specific recombinase XerD
MEEHLPGFVTWLRSEGRSTATVRKYRYTTERFLRWLAYRHPKERLTKGILRAFGAELKDQALRPSTQHGYAAALSQFFLYLRDEQGVSGLPDANALGVDPPDPPERISPSREEVQALLRTARQMPAHTIRSAYERGRALCIVGLACLAGLRRGEILKLELRDVEPGQIRVRRGKGGKGRRVPISDELHVILEEWSLTRAAWCREHSYQSEALIPTRQGKAITETGFAAVWNDLRARSGIERHVTPHGGRHWFGSTMAGAVGYVEAMAALGHTNIATTQKYLHSDPAELSRGIAAVGEASRDPAKPQAPKPAARRTRRTPGERKYR